MWSFRVEENQEGNVRIPLTNLTPIYPRNIVVPVPNQDMEFNVTYQGLYCIHLVQLRSEVVVRFVHIGGIDDHHCLNCLFIIVFFLVIVLSVLLRFTSSDYHFGIFLVIVLSVLLRFTSSDYPFGIFLVIVLSVLLRFTSSDYLFGIFLVIVLSVLLRFTSSDYPFGIFKLFFKIVSDDHIKSQHGYCIYHYITEKHVTNTNIIYL